MGKVLWDKEMGGGEQARNTPNMVGKRHGKDFGQPKKMSFQ